MVTKYNWWLKCCFLWGSRGLAVFVYLVIRAKGSSLRLFSWYFLALGESEAHKHLLTNPVISLFINLKWQKIAPIYSNYQRFLYFFYMILTWYIVAMFGGTSTRQRNAIHPNPKELCCPINETKKTDGQPDSSTGDAIIFIAFAFLVSSYSFF